MGDNNLYTFKDLSKEKDLKSFQMAETRDYVAPALFKDDLMENQSQAESQKSPIHSVVDQVMPQKLVSFSNVCEYILKGFYTFKNSKGVEKKGTKSPSKGYMKPVIENLRALDSFLQGDIPMHGEALDVNALDSAQTYFNNALDACDKYLDKRKNPWTDEGKARYAMVSDLREKVAFESMRFSEQITAMKKDPFLIPEDGKWVSILADIRTEKYEDGKDDTTVTMGGAGTTDIIIVEKNGVKKYIKQTETVALENPAIYMKEERQRLKANIKKDKSDKISKMCFHYLDTLMDCISTRSNNDYSFFFYEMHVYFSKKKTNATPETILNYIYQKLSEFGVEIDKLEKDEDKKIVEKYIADYVLKLKKDNMLRRMAVNTAKIDEGGEVTKRNAATRRIADMLGIGDLVVKTETVQVKIGDKTIKGIAMDHAAGDSENNILKMAKEQNKKVTYSQEAYRQMLTLQIFDVLCGQVDRNTGNYLCDYEQDAKTGDFIIKKITAIDNDMSFGVLGYQQHTELSDNMTGNIIGIENRGRMQIPAIDYKLAQAILAMKPSDLEYRMMDILNKNEIIALADRLKGLQRAILNGMDEETQAKAKGKKVKNRFPKDENEWAENKKQVEDEVVLVSQVRKKLEAKAYNKNLPAEQRNKAYRQLEKLENNDVENFSYLRSEFMGG